MFNVKELVELLQKQEDQDADVNAMVDDIFDMSAIVLYTIPDTSTPDEINVICRF